MKAGAPTMSVQGAGLRVAVLAASWHTEIMNALVAGASRALAESAVDHPTILRVPGTIELTVAASRLAPHYDALVALGVVIRGETPHFDYVCQSVTQGLTAVSVRDGIPIGFGVLTCDDQAQAIARAGLPGSAEDKGAEAALAAVATAVTLTAHAPRTIEQ